MINQETKTLSIRGQHAPDSAAFCLKQGSTYSGSSPQRGQHLPDWHANTSCNRSCTSEIPALLKGSAWSGLSKQVLFFDFTHFLIVGAVPTGHFQASEQFLGVVVNHLVALLTSLMTQGRGQEAFAHSGRTGDQHVFLSENVAAFGQAQELGLVQIARGGKVGLLYRGLITEAGIAQMPVDLPLLAVFPFGLQEQFQGFFVGQ